MKSTKLWLALVLAPLMIAATSCDKKTIEEVPEKIELLITLDADSTKAYSITGCDQIKIDSIQGEGYTYLTISGCGHTFQDSVIVTTYYPDWYYNCYPVYDSQGVYLYDDCYWEYY